MRSEAKMGVLILSNEVTENVPSNNPTAKAFTLTSAFWFAAATSFGMIAAGYLIAPDFLANVEYIHFGRVRPMHINAVLFGFVTPGFLAAAFYYFPKLLRTISTGHTQGREYAELPWTVDIMVIISFALVVINILMTIRQRQEPILFVSIWYTTAAVILTSITYCLGNVIWKPDTGALLGIPDAILLWFYGHNIFGLLLTPMGLAIAYYVLPIATPYIVAAGILVADHRLHPHRHPSSAAGSGAHLAKNHIHR
jgi:cbb3-type cytochrome oxidase subunit 1